MFEGDLTGLDDDALAGAGVEFRRVRERAEVRFLELALVFADRNHEPHRPTTGEIVPGIERIRVYGGAGCPGVAEFAPVEFGALHGMSAGAASDLIGEALALRHRLPRVWARVLAGKAEAWRARKIARACLSLSQRAAALVDAQVEAIVNTVTPYRLTRIMTAAMMQADPDLAKAAADHAARSRGVWIGQSDIDGTKTAAVRAAAGDVIRFNAMVQDLAEALGELGDTDSLDERRAKAIGWIADPDAATGLRQAARQSRRTRTTDPDGEDADAGFADGGQDLGGEEPDLGGEEPGLGGEEPGLGGESDPMDEPVSGGQSDQTGGPVSGGQSDQTGEPVSGGQSDQTGGPVSDGQPDQTGEPELDDFCGFLDAREADGDPCVGDPTGTEPRDADDDGGHAFTRGGTLAQRLADIKARSRTGSPHTVYVHLTDLTLTNGDGVVRIEGYGPLLASQLAEFLGHDKVILKPVIDLRDRISVDAYEAPDRLRERIRLTHPITLFPWSNTETTTSTDLDHVVPYDDTGPPGQTNSDNLTPLSRFQHRLKTHGGWTPVRLPDGGIEWTSPRGNRYRVDHAGTHRISDSA